MPTKYGFIPTGKVPSAVHEIVANKVAREIDASMRDILKDLADANGWDDSRLSRKGTKWFLQYEKRKGIEVEVEVGALVIDTELDVKDVIADRLCILNIDTPTTHDDGDIHQNIGILKLVLENILGIPAYIFQTAGD